MKRRHWQFTALVIATGLTTGAAVAESQSLIDQAIKEYEAGHYEAAVPLLLKDLRENGSDGKAHQYLGLAMKKLGQSEEAVNQLEMAAKICPPGAIEAIAKEAITKEGLTKEALLGGEDETTPPPAPTKPVAQPPQDFFSQLSGNVQTFFGLKKADPNAAPSKPLELSMMPMPDLFGGMRDAVKSGRRWLRKNVKINKDPAPHSHGINTSADVIPMSELMELVNDSKNSKWQSHPDGVQEFDQAPEYSPEWDMWIKRFRRRFNHILLRRLAMKAKDDTAGMAGVIFSLDNAGHLRGRIYESTANDTLNDCLLHTIRDMNNTTALTFPYNTNVTGWNFRMRWNFAKFIAVIKQFRASQQLARIAASTAYSVTSTDAKIARIKEEDALRAQAKKLAADKATALAKLVPTGPNFKTNVSGLVLPKAKPLELQAKALTLSDVKLDAHSVAPAPVEPLNVDEMTPEQAAAIDRILESP